MEWRSRPANANAKRSIEFGREAGQDSPEIPTVAEVQVLRRHDFPERHLLREMRQVSSLVYCNEKDASVLFGLNPGGQIVGEPTLLGNVEL
jgi:hypothetical protein